MKDKNVEETFNNAVTNTVSSSTKNDETEKIAEQTKFAPIKRILLKLQYKILKDSKDIIGNSCIKDNDATVRYCHVTHAFQSESFMN